MKLTLASREDAYNFQPGMVVDWMHDENLVPVRVTRLHRLRFWLRHKTRWFRPRNAVTEIWGGTVTITRERWSWMRWQWVRA